LEFYAVQKVVNKILVINDLNSLEPSTKSEIWNLREKANFAEIWRNIIKKSLKFMSKNGVFDRYFTSQVRQSVVQILKILCQDATEMVIEKEELIANAIAASEINETNSNDYRAQLSDCPVGIIKNLPQRIVCLLDQEHQDLLAQLFESKRRLLNLYTKLPKKE
jgi:hypothetical protein